MLSEVGIATYVNTVAPASFARRARPATILVCVTQDFHMVLKLLTLCRLRKFIRFVKSRRDNAIINPLACFARRFGGAR